MQKLDSLTLPLTEPFNRLPDGWLRGVALNHLDHPRVGIVLLEQLPDDPGYQRGRLAVSWELGPGSSSQASEEALG
ncbi:hypothetical protein, partial [Thermogemmatispora sp.]|uniref:hypothetical protein n=1 Tax=Thermogemmatispora sp. TaxID=1968838 RepID=UPI0025795B6C